MNTALCSSTAALSACDPADREKNLRKYSGILNICEIPGRFICKGINNFFHFAAGPFCTLLFQISFDYFRISANLKVDIVYSFYTSVNIIIL